jgi:hypothetical protein
MRRIRSLWLALSFAALVFAPMRAAAQTSSMFSNLANPAIGMNALFSAQGAPNLDQAYGPHFDEAELSVISVVDPYWTFSGNIVFAGDGTVDPEEIWARSTNIPGIQLKLGKLRGTFGKHGQLHYGQQHIMPSRSGDPAPMAGDPPTFLFITGMRRSPELRGQSLTLDLDQEV